MDFKVYGWMFRKLGLNSNSVLVFAVLYQYHVVDKNTIPLSIHKISQILGITERAVQKIIYRLCSKGYIKKTKVTLVNNLTYNHYTVISFGDDE